MAYESSRIELVLEYTLNRCVYPKVAVSYLGFVVSEPFAEHLLLVIARCFYILVIEDFCNSLESVARGVHLEYPTHDGCLFFYDHNLSRVLILEVTHRRNDDYSFLLLLLISRANFARDISAIHIVEDALEAYHKLVIFIACVNVFGYRENTHFVLS